MLIKSTIVFLCLGSTLAYTMKGGNPIPLPVQTANPADPDTFIRYEQPLYHILSCPQGFQFDGSKMKCVRNPKAPKEADALRCPPFFMGTVPYEHDCRKFVNCWFGMGFLQQCGSVLLYKDKHHMCDYPERANCCEYWEKNAMKLVE